MSVKPEALLRKAFNEAGISSSTGFKEIKANEFVVILRTSSSKVFLDSNRSSSMKTYNFLLQCYSLNGEEAAGDFADRVADILEELYWHQSVSAVEAMGQSPLPNLNKYTGTSVSAAISII